MGMGKNKTVICHICHKRLFSACNPKKNLTPSTKKVDCDS